MIRVKVTQTRMRANVDSKIRNRIEKAIRETAEEVAAVAKDLAPEDTGALKASIHAERGQDDAWRAVAGDDGDVNYAGYVEWGTSKMEAQPYMRPAVNFLKERLRRRLGRIEAGLAQDLGQNVRISRVKDYSEE